MARRVGAESQAEWGGCLLQARLNAAGLNDGGARARIDGHDLVEVAREVEDNARSDRIARAGGASASAGHGDLVFARKIEGCENIFDACGEDEGERGDPVQAGVGRVSGARARGGVDLPFDRIDEGVEEGCDLGLREGVSGSVGLQACRPIEGGGVCGGEAPGSKIAAVEFNAHGPILTLPGKKKAGTLELWGGSRPRP